MFYSNVFYGVGNGSTWRKLTQTQGENMQTPHRKKGHQACDQQSCQSKSVIMADQLTTVTFVSLPPLRPRRALFIYSMSTQRRVL